jgi:isocitrate dehydrogenase kinase/phosphatase
VGPDDVFPEEFSSFLGVEGDLRQAFLDKHSDLLTARWWQDTQRRVGAGEVIDIFPYEDRLRLQHPEWELDADSVN